MNTEPNQISLIINIFLSFLKSLNDYSAIITICLAIIGLFIWKSQHLAKMKYEIANKFISSIYQFRSDLLYATKISIKEGEIEYGRYQLSKMGINEVELSDNEIAYKYRKLRMIETYDKLEIILYEAIAKLGPNIAKKFIPIREIYIQADLLLSTGNWIDFDKDRFEVDLKNAIVDLQEHLSPILKLHSKDLKST